MKFIGNVQLIAGNSGTVGELTKLLSAEGVETTGNPDVYIREYSSFGIDEARELGRRASMRPVLSERRIFILVTPGMTPEAQNALLKTFEEPSGDALFFLIVPSPQTLLPTLRSRAQLLKLTHERQESPVDVAQFLKADPEKRLDMLKPLFEKDEEDKRDLAGSIQFLAGLEREFSGKPRERKEALRAVYLARKYIVDKGSLQKALLEQIALLI